MFWSIKEVELPLKVTWAISRNSTDVKRNLIVELRSQEIKAFGEIAFNVRYGESLDLIKQKFEEFKESAPKEFRSVEELIAFLENGDFPQSLKFGLESAFVHYLSILSGKSVPELLGLLPVNSVKTSFSIPIMEIGKIKDFIEKENLKRFHCIKVKIGKEGALDLVQNVLANYSGPIRIDANEAFSSPDQVMKFLEELGVNQRIEFLEEPLSSDSREGYLELKKKTPVLLIADESVTAQSIGAYYQERFHGVNIKLQKSGGYFKALKQLREARSLGLKTMLGCMVETSLGISSAMNIAHGVDYFDLDGFLLIKGDPYKIISEENGKLFYSFMQ